MITGSTSAHRGTHENIFLSQYPLVCTQQIVATKKIMQVQAETTCRGGVASIPTLDAYGSRCRAWRNIVTGQYYAHVSPTGGLTSLAKIIKEYASQRYFEHPKNTKLND